MKLLSGSLLWKMQLELKRMWQNGWLEMVECVEWNKGEVGLKSAWLFERHEQHKLTGRTRSKGLKLWRMLYRVAGVCKQSPAHKKPKRS